MTRNWSNQSPPSTLPKRGKKLQLLHCCITSYKQLCFNIPRPMYCMLMLAMKICAYDSGTVTKFYVITYNCALEQTLFCDVMVTFVYPPKAAFLKCRQVTHTSSPFWVWEKLTFRDIFSTFFQLKHYLM